MDRPLSTTLSVRRGRPTGRAIWRGQFVTAFLRLCDEKVVETDFSAFLFVDLEQPGRQNRWNQRFSQPK